MRAATGSRNQKSARFPEMSHVVEPSRFPRSRARAFQELNYSWGGPIAPVVARGAEQLRGVPPLNEADEGGAYFFSHYTA